jgi:hypothetical protein
MPSSLKVDVRSQCMSHMQFVHGRLRYAKNASAVEEALSQVALRNGVVGGLLVRPAERLAELGDMLRRREACLFEWRAVEGAECDGLRRLGYGLPERCRCRYGEGSPQKERHGVCVSCRWRRELQRWMVDE